MRTAKLLSRSIVSQHQRVRCAIGHDTRADVWTANYRHFDMDGYPMTPFSVEEYKPSTCVVCGSRIWARLDALPSSSEPFPSNPDSTAEGPEASHGSVSGDGASPQGSEAGSGTGVSS